MHDLKVHELERLHILGGPESGGNAYNHRANSNSRCSSSLTCCHEALFLRALQHIDDCIEEVRLALTRVKALHLHRGFKGTSSVHTLTPASDPSLLTQNGLQSDSCLLEAGR